MSFIENYSRELVIYLMSSKDQVFAKYKLYEAMMSRQQDVCIKTLFTDRGGEYTSKEFEEYLANKGTKHRLTVHDTPEQNGVAELLNRTLVEKSRAMLIESNLLKSLWGYAILHANYIKNRMHTCSLLDKTPYEMVHGKKLNLRDAYEWGKDVYVKIKQDDNWHHELQKPSGLETPHKATGV